MKSLETISKFICKIIGHRDRDDFDIDREPMFMWRCIRCGRCEEMQFTCLTVRLVSDEEVAREVLKVVEASE